MTGAVHHLPGKTDVDDAWDAYKALWDAEIADPSLRGDRAHCEALTAAWVRFNELYARECRVGNVVPIDGVRA